MKQQVENEELLIHEIRQLIKELHPELRSQPNITLDSVLDRDLGLDSMARMELLARLEGAFELHLHEEVITIAETPRDILRSLKKDSGNHSGSISGIIPENHQTSEPCLIADQALTLTDVLIGHAKTQGEQVHIYLEQFSNESTTISYSELLNKAENVAANLQQRFLQPGDSVAIMLPTGVDYFYCFFGILLAGCTPVPLYPPTRPSQIEEHLRRHNKILENAQVKILITIPEALLIGKLMQARITTLEAIITPKDFTLQEKEFHIPPIQENDTAFLQYTSGSTGDPKGVILNHKNLLANIRAMGTSIDISPNDVFVSWLPLYHDMGLIGAWLGSLYYGCRLVIMSPLSFLARPERWLQTIHKYRGTLSASPNFGYEVSCRRIDEKSLDGLDLSSWRLAFNGAEPVSSKTLDSFSDRFEPYGFKRSSFAPVYGLAESSVGLAFPPLNRGPIIDHVSRDHFVRTGEAIPAQEGDDRLGFVACGQPLPGHQIRIVDTEGRELPERQQGRLEFKGPSTTSGYLRNPDETRKLFSGEWLDSGDLAYSADGDIYLTSRIKDIIIRGGRNVYPHQLEEAIGNLQGIRKGCVAVFGSMDKLDGTERLVVLAETRILQTETLGELRNHITSITVDLLNMPPDEVVLAPPGSVLKTSSGKIRRSSTRILFEKGQIGKKNRPVWLQFCAMALATLPSFSSHLLQKLSNYLYAAYCWLLYGLLGVPLWLLVTTIPKQSICWRVTHGCTRLLAALTGTALQVEGKENLDHPGAKILVSNHMSYMDSLILCAVIDKPVCFVGKAELSKSWWLRKPLENIGVVFVERFDAEQGLEDSKRLSQLVASGKRVLFFAEGTLQRMPGLLPFRMGAFLTATNNTTDVVPITIRGTRNKLRAGSWFPRRGKVRVFFSKPIAHTGNDWEAALTLRNKVRQEILSRLGEPDLATEYLSLKQMKIDSQEKKEK